MRKKLDSISKYRKETNKMEAKINQSKGKLTNIIHNEWDQVTYMDNYMSNKEKLNELKYKRRTSVEINNGS
jgi:hypothetical protein